MIFDLRALNQQTVGWLQIIFGLMMFVCLCWYSGRSPSPPRTFRFGHYSESYTPVMSQYTEALVDSAEQTLQTQSRHGGMLTEEMFRDLRYVVEPDDTLEAIFKRKQFSVAELYEILEADEPYLVLDVLRPGDQLIFKVGQSNALYALSLILDLSKTVSYLRGEDGFIFDETLTPTTNITEVTRGEITRSFFASASKAGLSDSVIMTINQLLKNTLNFRRDLRAGDHFQVMIEREIIDGQPIGQDRLLAVRINSNREEFGAYLHNDGSYYDENGDSLIPALLRFPTQKQFRISSHFNPRRLHPVTKRYAPHNGVDFAMSVGTPVLSTGDGRVTRVAHHRFAGKYIVIKQFGPYTTRYLHMSKIFVANGQQVERGQVIGLSGNTGRSTGPHLHYELHVNGKPVNPMTTDIPMLKSISRADIGDFRMLVQHMQELMLGENRIVNRFKNPANENQRVNEQNKSEKSISRSAADVSTSS